MAKKKKKRKSKKVKKIKKRKKVVERKKRAKKSKAKRKGKATVYLGLGSNVGDREEYIEQAIFLLEKNPHIEVTRHSSSIETEAEGKGNQPPFLNAALEIKTKLSPHKLLEVCHEIEVALGREREIEWGPRTIDIDILMYEDEIISDDKLQLPHPLLHERLFVLRPLREIAPNLMHPVLEKRMQSLYEERKAELGSKYDDELPGFKEIKGGAIDDYERW
ncbi:2-amino-4-hydroxy-6-hydroxymethyldihydropteridine diphosphokinase [Candidatus Margulisiibacteriota bacterium]